MLHYLISHHGNIIMWVTFIRFTIIAGRVYDKWGKRKRSHVFFLNQSLPSAVTCQRNDAERWDWKTCVLGNSAFCRGIGTLLWVEWRMTRVVNACFLASQHRSHDVMFFSLYVAQTMKSSSFIFNTQKDWERLHHTNYQWRSTKHRDKVLDNLVGAKMWMGSG